MFTSMTAVRNFWLAWVQGSLRYVLFSFLRSL